MPARGGDPGAGSDDGRGFDGPRGDTRGDSSNASATRQSNLRPRSGAPGESSRLLRLANHSLVSCLESSLRLVVDGAIVCGRRSVVFRRGFLAEAGSGSKLSSPRLPLRSFGGVWVL